MSRSQQSHSTEELKDGRYREGQNINQGGVSLTSLEALTACAPDARMLDIFREIGEELLKLALKLKLGVAEYVAHKTEINLSLSPSIKTCFEKRIPQLSNFDDANAAVRILKDLDGLIPNAESTVVVLDELEELNSDDRTDLAFLIKQLGDQEFKIKFILVGIAENGLSCKNLDRLE